MIKLKPCPFCGGIAIIRNDNLSQGVEGCIECIECGAVAFASDWNTRTESAWELARKILLPLNEKDQIELYTRILLRMPDMLNYEEQEAIKIMQEIEKELKE